MYSWLDFLESEDAFIFPDMEIDVPYNYELICVNEEPAIEQTVIIPKSQPIQLLPKMPDAQLFNNDYANYLNPCPNNLCLSDLPSIKTTILSPIKLSSINSIPIKSLPIKSLPIKSLPIKSLPINSMHKYPRNVLLPPHKPCWNCRISRTKCESCCNQSHNNSASVKEYFSKIPVNKKMTCKTCMCCKIRKGITRFNVCKKILNARLDICIMCERNLTIARKQQL